MKETERNNSIIYLDHAATAPLRPEALNAMLPYLTEKYGNASAIYSIGSAARDAISECRRQIASLIGAKSQEIYFTSGGTESDNWALKMTAEKLDAGKKAGEKHACRGHIITTQIEHHAVLNSCRTLEKNGFEITRLPVNAQGFVNPEDVEAAIRPDTVLISVMAANNEIGTVEPLRPIGEIARRHGIWFHTDAVQAFGHIPIDVEKMHIDFLSASAHKIGGPKGVGLMYMRRGIELPSLMDGGGQERGHRAGTENVAGIVGFTKAAVLAFQNMESSREYTEKLRNHLIERVLNEIPGSHLNGPDPRPESRPAENAMENRLPQLPNNAKENRLLRLPNNANFRFDGLNNETMLVMLDLKGVCASGASACSAGSLEPSHVLKAVGLSEEQALSSLRFTAGTDNTLEQIDRAADILIKVTEHLRKTGRG